MRTSGGNVSIWAYVSMESFCHCMRGGAWLARMPSARRRVVARVSHANRFVLVEFWGKYLTFFFIYFVFFFLLGTIAIFQQNVYFLVEKLFIQFSSWLVCCRSSSTYFYSTRFSFDSFFAEPNFRCVLSLDLWQCLLWIFEMRSKLAGPNKPKASK
jgi:hypothetical protein